MSTRNEQRRPAIWPFLLATLVALVAWHFETQPRAIVITPPPTGMTPSGSHIEATFNAYLVGNESTTGVLFGMYTPTKAVNLDAIQCGDDINPVGCTVNAQIEIAVAGTAQASTLCTFANGVNGCSASFSNIAVNGGQLLQFKVTTGAGGCTTIPQNINCTMEFTTQ